MRRAALALLGHIIAAPITLLSVILRREVLEELAMLCCAGAFVVGAWLVFVVLFGVPA